MTRTPHDQFAKQYLAELLAPWGQVDIGHEVSPEVREVDVWFVPSPSPATDPQVLGLLGKMASGTCLLEPYRNPATPIEVRTCLLKLFSLHGELLRQARREGNSLLESDLASLWILLPSCSARIIKGFGSQLDETGNWPSGVYFLPEMYKTAIVAINKLPLTEETLWLRILGRGKVQKQAINELTNLPKGHPLLNNALEVLSNWRMNLDSKEIVSNEEQELIMNLSPAYQQWREDTLQQGRQAGLQEGQQEGQKNERRLMIENFFRVRFGSIDEPLENTIALMLEIPVEELTLLLLNGTREEILERFGSQ